MMINQYSFLFIFYVGFIGIILAVNILSVIWRLNLDFLIKRKTKEIAISESSVQLISRSFSHKKRKFPGFFIQIIKTPFQSLKLFTLSLVMVAISVYIFSSAFEIIFNRTVPYAGSMINALEPAKSQALLTSLTEDMYISDTGTRYDALGKDRKFTTLRIPRLNIRLDTIPQIRTGDIWMYRPNSMHYFFLSKDEKSDPNYLVMYAQKNWRSINNPYDIQVGDNVFVQKDDKSNAMFRIVEKVLIPSNTSYVPARSDTLGMILIIDDPTSSMSYVVKANYIDINTISSR